MKWLGPVLALGLVVSAGPAFGSRSPRVSVNWTESTPAPWGATRFDGQYNAAKGRVYFLGYRAADNTTSGEVWFYKVATHTYVDTGVAMPVPVSNYEIAALTDATGLGYYIFGGRDDAGNIVTDVQVYYPATNTTATIASDPWPGKTPSGCVSLPGTGVAVEGNNAYVLGGLAFSANGCVDEQSHQTWRFNPMGTAGSRWKKQPNLHVSRGYITPAVIGKKIYAIGGDTNSGGTLFASQTVESWTVGTTSWKDTSVADLPEACDESQAFGFASGPLAKTITLAGCGQWPSTLPDVLQYDVVANSWSTVGTLNEARRNQAGAQIGTNLHPKLFVLGGYAPDGATALMTSEIGKPGARSGARAGGSRGAASTTGRAPTS